MSFCEYCNSVKVHDKCPYCEVDEPSTSIGRSCAYCNSTLVNDKCPYCESEDE
jgi:hypothetical protein